MFYHEPPKVLVQELMHMAAARGIIDLTAGSGVWAEAALEAQVPYFGLVLTDVHLSELRNHLIKQAAGVQWRAYLNNVCRCKTACCIFNFGFPGSGEEAHPGPELAPVHGNRSCPSKRSSSKGQRQGEESAIVASHAWKRRRRRRRRV